MDQYVVGQSSPHAIKVWTVDAPVESQLTTNHLANSLNEQTLTNIAPSWKRKRLHVWRRSEAAWLRGWWWWLIAEVDTQLEHTAGRSTTQHCLKGWLAGRSEIAMWEHCGGERRQAVGGREIRGGSSRGERRVRGDKCTYISRIFPLLAPLIDFITGISLLLSTANVPFHSWNSTPDIPTTCKTSDRDEAVVTITNIRPFLLFKCFINHQHSHDHQIHINPSTLSRRSVACIGRKLTTWRWYQLHQWAKTTTPNESTIANQYY